MRWVAFGTEPVGVVAVGFNATGVIAFGQLATGVVAVGQLSRGVVTVGQLSIGVVAVGQLAVGLVWALGQLGIAALGGPGLVWGPLGRLSMRRVFGRGTGPVVTAAPRLRGSRAMARIAVVVVVVAIWSVAAGAGLVSGLGDISDGGNHPPPTTSTTSTTVLR